MATEYLSDVRNELQSRSTRTTLDELKKKGLEQVRVIRSSQILELIEQAVDRALARRGESADPAARQELLQNSAQIFRDLLRSEMQQGRAADDQRIDAMKSQMERYAAEMRALVDQVAQKDALVAEAKARQAELEAELRVLRQRSQAGSPEDLLEELRALRKEIGKQPAPAAAVGLEQKLQNLGQELTSQIERIGRKVGIGAAEESPADISGLFTSIPELESNLDAVEAKERKGSDVADALARMKSLKERKPDA
jgi:hypothetical protein